MEQICECGVEEGQLHVFGCRWEICPFCEATFVEGCGCVYDLLGLRSRMNSPQQEGLPRETYEEGLTTDQEAAWQSILEARGRLPFLDKPQLCGRCGALWPDMFIVPDVAWDYYSGPQFRDAMLCEACFRSLWEAIDRHQPRPAWVPSDTDIEAYLLAWRTGDRATMERLDPAKFKPGSRRPRMPRLGMS